MILVVGGYNQGKMNYVNQRGLEGYTILDKYHERIRKQLEDKLDPIKEVETLINENDKLVIICDEVGYGLVPMDSFERAYRETVGRVCCLVAEKADEVIRVVAGIGMKIK